MPTQEQLAHVLRQVALGDESATTVFAQYLDERIGNIQAQRKAQAEQVTAAEVEAYYKGLWRFRDQHEALAKEFPVLDQKRDPEAYEVATELDKKIAEKRPNLSDEERLRLVAERTYQRMGDPEERDYKSAIESMRQARMPKAFREVSGDEEIEWRADNTDSDDVGAEIDRNRSEFIAQMARDRKARPGIELSEDQRARIRQSRRG